MIPLSVVIITFNEEANIARCLESVKGVADEVVVVDSLSKDRTRAICESYGVRFIEQPWRGYIAQKNYAAAQAAHDLVLSLDADEALSEELKLSVMQMKETPEADGYTMNRLTNYCGRWIRHCGWYPDRKLRLFDRRKGQWDGQYIHESVLMEPTSIVRHLSGDLLHFSYYSIEQHIKQVNDFTQLNAQRLAQNDRKPSLLKIIGSAWFRFFRDYFLRGGFRDGYYGFVICRISAHASFLKYAKTRQLWEQKKHRDS